MLSYARFLEYMYIVSYMKTKLVMVLSLVVNEKLNIPRMLHCVLTKRST